MAKDGTNRGGARPGAGRPRKALAEKIAEGKTAEVMMQPANIESAETPPVRNFMKELQRDGTKLLADDVYTETYQWLKERSCEKIVSRQLVEQYAMSISRWIHCEQIVTKYGYISKHPTTGAAIASPYVAMSQNYMKQANQGQIRDSVTLPSQQQANHRPSLRPMPYDCRQEYMPFSVPL